MIGKSIKEIREQLLFLTREELARKAGIPLEEIVLAEEKNIKPKYTSLVMIANLADIPVASLHIESHEY